MDVGLTPSSDHAIIVQGLRKTYGSLIAVDDIELSVAAGQVCALLGPNGAGKTTTIDILTGQQKRCSGHVRVLGIDPEHGDAAHRARVGVVPQTSGDFDELTVSEVIRHFTAYYPQPRDSDEVLQLVGLTAKTNSRVKHLSGGQRRRLDVALGLVGNPEVLFLDEPTVGFDPVARREFWQLVRGLAVTGTTVMLTTHYLEEAEALADKVAVLAAGKLVAVAAPHELGGRPTANATIRWADPNAPAGYQQIITDTPTATVREIAQKFPGEIPELTISRPSLEDIYLEMIGAT